MNVSQVSSSEVTYESAKSTSAASNSKEDSGFKKLLKDKSSKVSNNKSESEGSKSDKVKTSQSKKPKSDNTEDDSSAQKDGNSYADTTAESQIASMMFNQNASVTNMADSAVETGFIQSGVIPLNIVSNESELQLSKSQQNVYVYTVDSLGVHSLKGNQISVEGLKVNDSQSNDANSQQLLGTADIKKDSVVFADGKSSELSDNENQMSSGKQSIISDSNLTDDEAGNDLSKLNPFEFKPKENMINIKVADPDETKSWETVANDIGEAVVESVKDNKIEKLNISMNPRELGEIKVEFEMGDDGISVSFICSSEKTKKLLADNTDMLSKIIQTNLKQDTAVNVSYSEKSGRQESNSNSNNENFDGRGNNGGYKDGSGQNNRHDNSSDKDFLQKLRLGIVDIENTEV